MLLLSKATIAVRQRFFASICARCRATKTTSRCSMEDKMRPQALGKCFSVMTGSRIWIVFGLLFAAMVCSTIVGTQSVRAQAACSSGYCTGASGYATFKCQNFGGVAYFECPSPINCDGYDDFLFLCAQPGAGDGCFDCSNIHNPS